MSLHWFLHAPYSSPGHTLVVQLIASLPQRICEQNCLLLVPGQDMVDFSFLLDQTKQTQIALCHSIWAWWVHRLSPEIRWEPQARPSLRLHDQLQLWPVIGPSKSPFWAKKKWRAATYQATNCKYKEQKLSIYNNIYIYIDRWLTNLSGDLSTEKKRYTVSNPLLLEVNDANAPLNLFTYPYKLAIHDELFALN